MLAQLILALYNVVDSYFVGHYSDDGLTALSVIYPIQLCITALAVGTGVGVNTFMARRYAQNENEDADKTAGTGLVLALVSWAVFAVLAVCVMEPFVKLCTSSPQVIKDAVTYGNIVSVGSIGVFLEGCFTKVHQASGNMKLPTIAQVVGALINIVLIRFLSSGSALFRKWAWPVRPSRRSSGKLPRLSSRGCAVQDVRRSSKSSANT